MRNLLIIAFTVFSLQLMAKSIKIDRVEPPHWYIGMYNPEVMLMIHAENIGETTPTVDYPGVNISRIDTTDNLNYIFVYLDIAADTPPGTLKLNFKKGNKTVAKYNYELRTRREGSAEREGFTSADVIYLIMPDRFANGNPDNDSGPEMTEKTNRGGKYTRHGGDIEGIIGKLDYLDDLGVTAIWNTPVQEDNAPQGSYHMYACSDMYRIDPRFGSNEDYQRLSAEMKKRDMKLIIDLVPNHIGTEHWWMDDMPAKDWLNVHEKYTQSNHRKNTWHDPYVADIDRELNEKGWFVPSMPDLNQENPLLLQYLKQHAIWWVEYADLDGIRVDTYPYVEQWMAADWTKAIMNEYPKMNIVGECWMYTTAQIAYWQTGVKNSNGYDSYLPTVMDFQFHEKSHAAFNEDNMEWDKGMVRFYELYTLDYLYANTNNILTFLDNHDTHRFAEAVGHDVNKIKLGITLLLTTRGIPQIYYGTEIGMGGSKQVGDDDLRREIPGGWPGDERNAFTKEGRTDKEQEIFKHMQNLLQFRKANPVMQTGKTLHYIPENNVYVYFRYNDEKTVMVIINNSDKSHTLKAERFKQGLGEHTKGYNILTKRERDLNGNIEVKAKTSIVLELK